MPHVEMQTIITKISILLLGFTFISAYGREHWPAGSELTALQADSLLKNGAFKSVELPANVVEKMRGKSFKDDDEINLSSLRYLPTLYVDAEGKKYAGELVCATSICEDLEVIFYELYKGAYPIEKMVLIDEYDADDIKSMEANNTSCFNYRRIAGSSSLSKHAQGRAVDLNPFYNPYVKGAIVSPPSAKKYEIRDRDWDYKIKKNDLAYRLFKSHGFKWGGEWTSLKDWQHFEK